LSGYLAKRLHDPEVERALSALPNDLNELGFDPWGFHADAAVPLYGLARRIHDYFRPEIHGIEHLPRGRVLLVANHSGQLPLDGVVIAVATLLRGAPPRLVRPMFDRWFPKVPYVNEAIIRAGAVLGDPINCRNLLESDQAILVFPEGTKGSGKPFHKRYQLQEFGRGFMRLALQTDSPVVPVAVIGGEESIISLHDVKPLARLLGMPYFPVSPFFPLFGVLGYLPLPVKFHVHFGEPMRFSGRFDDEDAVIDQKVGEARARIQQMIDAGLRTRRGIFT
jgi:1-acyl-sn-glycerol-3-phosphate acyltransferase